MFCIMDEIILLGLLSIKNMFYQRKQLREELSLLYGFCLTIPDKILRDNKDVFFHKMMFLFGF